MSERLDDPLATATLSDPERRIVIQEIDRDKIVLSESGFEEGGKPG